MLLLEIKI